MTTMEYMYNRARKSVSKVALHGMVKTWKKAKKRLCLLLPFMGVIA